MNQGFKAVGQLAGAAVLSALLLAACGGGGASTDRSPLDARESALAVAPQSSASVVSLTKVSETRISRTVFDYVFKITVQNGPIAQTGVVASLTAVGRGTTIVDGTSAVGVLGAGAVVTPADTITLRQDRTYAFDAAALRWNVLGTPDPESAGAWVGSSGGTVTTPSGKVSVDIPPGALPQQTFITIDDASSSALPEGRAGRFLINLGPNGVTFAVPVTLTVKYDTTLLGEGWSPAIFKLAFFDGSAWVDIPTRVDVDRQVLIGQASHFSPYAYVTDASRCKTPTDPVYAAKLNKLAQGLFGLADPPTTGTGCVTEFYLEDHYSSHWSDLENHAGIDFRAASPGKKAYALFDGDVIREVLDSQHSTLVIQSTVGTTVYQIFYLHCQSHLSLTESTPPVHVHRGDQVCLTGAVGSPEGPHLHIEVKRPGMDNEVPALALWALTGKHCPSSSFDDGYDGITGQYDVHVVPGCTLADIAAKTVDPTVLVEPATPPQPLGVRRLSAGMDHTCAINNAGVAKCWGWNYNGQLGDGTAGPDATMVTTPVPVWGGGIDAAVDAGAWGSCGLTGTGAAKCWGYLPGLAGYLPGPDFTPVNVEGWTSGVAAISVGASHVCAIVGAGDVMCWGSNHHGELGNGTLTDGASAPGATVAGLGAGVKAISAGVDFTCALTSVGGVKCWGRNDLGQLGDGTSIASPRPVDVIGLTSGVLAVSAKWDHACAVTQLGSVKCWGDNEAGQLGNGNRLATWTPVSVAGLPSEVAAVAVGGTHTCALTRLGGVVCWGFNEVGQLGDGTTTDRLAPVAVVGLSSGVLELSAGSMHSCAMTQGGSVKCWGNNPDGALGDGTWYNYRTTPVDVLGF